jgi:hypothetical protein
MWFSYTAFLSLHLAVYDTGRVVPVHAKETNGGGGVLEVQIRSSLTLI